LGKGLQRPENQGFLHPFLFSNRTKSQVVYKNDYETGYDYTKKRIGKHFHGETVKV